MNCVDLIFEHVDRAPGRAALIEAGDAPRTVTYGALGPCVDRLAAALRRAGVVDAPATRVGLLCPDGADYVLLCLALLRAGACVVPIAGELSSVERKQLVEMTALDRLVLGRGAKWADVPGEAVAIEAGEVSCEGRVGVCGEEVGAAFDEEALAAMRPAFIRFSSGTTGGSKGIVLSHKRLHERIEAANKALAIGASDSVVWMLPMAHHFAVSMMLYLMKGATTVLVREPMAGKVLDAVHAHGGTVLYAAPFHHAMLAGEGSGRGWPGLRLAVSTAAGLPTATAAAFDRRFGVPLSQALGVIEVGLPMVNVARAREKPESVGQVLPDFELALRDEAGASVEAGEVGELYVRGPGMLDAYLVPWRPGGAALSEGWFRTGDLARRDAEGDVFLVGRGKTVINVAGLKCFPEEVEAVLNAHPQVRESRVYGRGHAHVGTVPVAEVVPMDIDSPPTAASLSTHCRQLLAAYKRPMQFQFVDALQRTASGKIRRAVGEAEGA
ncbi:class I adenylate-forming enzyme family protein [Phycisphaerales bacterium AB-hyl4]|uniref:Class I adenylate-forming enzyme family protein n=1 Tax=Natronomicrosphaera hydrolytica TaxID=3242702 RepID=A0ABV4U255_9BACT